MMLIEKDVWKRKSENVKIYFYLLNYIRRTVGYQQYQYHEQRR